MRRLPSEVLQDPRFAMPDVAAEPPGRGLAWLRAHVARFSEGPDHERRRAQAIAVIDSVRDAPFAGTPARTLLAALNLPAALEADLDLVAAAYQPHGTQSAAADAAADRLLHACGGFTEQAAARAGILVQAHAAMATFVELQRAGSDAPPVPATRRRTPEGETVEVDLTDAHFGRGPHQCPGEQLARRLARDALA